MAFVADNSVVLGQTRRTPTGTETLQREQAMDFITVGQMRTDSARAWDKIAAGEELVILRKGKPIAIIVATQPSEVDNMLRALRAASFDAALKKKHRHAAATGLGAINPEIPTVRKARGERNASGH